LIKTLGICDSNQLDRGNSINFDQDLFFFQHRKENKNPLHERKKGAVKEGRGTVLSIPVKQQTWRTEITETKKDNQLFQNLFHSFNKISLRQGRVEYVSWRVGGTVWASVLWPKAVSFNDSVNLLQYRKIPAFFAHVRAIKQTSQL